MLAEGGSTGLLLGSLSASGPVLAASWLVTPSGSSHHMLWR